MSEERLEAVLNEIARRKAQPKFLLKDFLFKEQLDFVNDPAPFKTAVCTRRSGKTIACAADLVWTAKNNKGVICVYITLSRSNAKKIIWPEIKKINRDYQLGGVPNESDLSIRFPKEESIVYCSGASDKTEIEKFRGLAIKKVYLDESQSFPSYIKDLVDDVISPALMDYAGVLCLIGTPGPVPTGFFYDCANSNDWSHHAWTFWSNPYIAIKSNLTHSEVLERELKRRGVTSEDPSIQREWYGKWVLDSDSLVFHYKEETNHYTQMPIAKPVYIMGVDFGYEDADAISILCWNENSPTTYLVEEVVVAKQGITPLANQIEFLQKKYGVSKIVADFGALGKKIAEEIIRRHKIPLEAADKSRKVESIELLNDAMRRGHFLAKRDSRFANDCMLMEWDKDKSNPEKKIVSDRFHSDICDAVLYSFKYSPAYTWTPPEIKPKYGTPEWATAETKRMEEAAEEHFSKINGNSSDLDWI